jgi:hypothetical protein
MARVAVALAVAITTAKGMSRSEFPSPFLSRAFLSRDPCSSLLHVVGYDFTDPSAL